MDTPGAAPAPTPWVRLVTVGIAGLVAALVLGLVMRAGGEPRAAAATVGPESLGSTLMTRASPAPSTPSAAAESALLPPGQDVLVLGDSLALSTYAWLADLLPDRYVDWEARVGRTTAEARVALSDLAGSQDLPPVIVVSSGTNDVDAGTLRREARRILAIAGPDRCVVWADVVRPADFGDGQAAANAALAAAWRGHGNVVPVRWTEMITEHPDWLTGDGVHPVEAGNLARARAFADAVLSCSPLDPDAPVASQEYLPAASFGAPGGGSVPVVGGGAPSTGTTRSASATIKPKPTRSSASSPPPSSEPSSEQPSPPASSSSGGPGPTEGGQQP